MKRLPLILMFVLTAYSVQSQDNVRIWSLQDCLNYALEQNIQVKKSKVTQLSGYEDL